MEHDAAMAHWSDVWPSFVGILLGGALALAGTLLAWWLARRADLRDRPRRELVPLASRLLAAVEAVYRAEQDVHASVMSLMNAEGQTSPNQEIVKRYAEMREDALHAHSKGVTEARTTAAEISLLYPKMANEADHLILATGIKGLGLRSEAEEAGYQEAREALMGKVRELAN